MSLATQDHKAPRPPRRSQAERSATTRAALIEAAVRCLNRHGYAATTVAMVAGEAEVSRGRMLHQFPAKVDLMLAVIEFATGFDEHSTRRRISARGDKRAQFMALTDLAWDVQTKPAAMAKLEIVMAARSDTVLAAELPALFTAIERRRRAGVVEMAREIGVKDSRAVETMVCLHMAAMRGLAIELTVTEDRRAVQRAFKMLKAYKTHLIDTLLVQKA